MTKPRRPAKKAAPKTPSRARGTSVVAKPPKKTAAALKAAAPSTTPGPSKKASAGAKKKAAEPAPKRTAKAQATRSRIVAAALALFNEQAPAQISTNHIAEALGISPGNLYYHFKNKDDIAVEIMEGLRGRTDVGLAFEDHESADPAALGRLLARGYDIIWDYRCIFLFLGDFLRIPACAVTYGQLQTTTIERIAELCRGLREAGIFVGPKDDEDIDLLAESVWIVATNWPAFASLAYGTDRPSPAQIATGMSRQIALMKPFLAPGLEVHLPSLTR